MAVLPKEMVLKRLRELPYDEAAFWREAAVTPDQVAAAIEKDRGKIAGVKAALVGDERAEVEVTYADGKVHVHRVIGAAASEAVERLSMAARA